MFCSPRYDWHAPLLHPSSCMLENHGPSQQSSKEEYKPWRWGATARYYASHTKTMLPTREVVRASTDYSGVINYAQCVMVGSSEPARLGCRVVGWGRGVNHLHANHSDGGQVGSVWTTHQLLQQSWRWGDWSSHRWRRRWGTCCAAESVCWHPPIHLRSLAGWLGWHQGPTLGVRRARSHTTAKKKKKKNQTNKSALATGGAVDKYMKKEKKSYCVHMLTMFW